MTDTSRTDSARDHDDSDIIDQVVADADSDAVATSGGGALQTDIGSRSDLMQDVDDPDGAMRPEKTDAIASDQAFPADRSRGER